MARRPFGHVRKMPSGRWQASYTDEYSGERILAPTTFRTKADANIWVSTVEADKARGTCSIPGSPSERSVNGPTSGSPGCM